MEDIEIFKVLAEEFVASLPAEFGPREIEKAFLLRERPEPGAWRDVTHGGCCPETALLYLSALPKAHKRAWRTEYMETDLGTGEKTPVKCLCVDASVPAARLFGFLERNDFEGSIDVLRDKYIAESIGA